MLSFEPTQPFAERDTKRVSDFVRYVGDLARETEAGPSRLSTLSPSLMLDLMRFEQPGRQTEMLEVLAASVRHRRPLTAHLRCERGLTTLTIFPLEQLVHCPMPMEQFLEMRLTELEVMVVEPTTESVPRQIGKGETVAAAQRYAPLALLSWELALRGARGDLLPEIPAQAAYRIPPGADLRAVELTGSLGTAVARLRRVTTNLRELSAWPGFDRERAMRLLNALYVQSALIVSRAHPAATQDGWSG